MIIGFTGSQHGMSEAQRPKVFKWLMVNAIKITEAHHGDCVGADEQFHTMCINLGIPRIQVHPPEDSTKQAYCRAPEGNTTTSVLILPRKPYLKRDEDIAEACTILLATPAQSFEVQRSGTWATIRYARKRRKPVFAFNPNDGSLLGQSKSTRPSRRKRRH